MLTSFQENANRVFKRANNALLMGVVPLLLMARREGQEPRNLTLRPPDAVAEVQFTGITSVRELSDGRLLVADRQEGRLALVEWRPGKGTTVGRGGEGPGEYNGVGWLYPIGTDSTLLTDWANGRWLLFSGAHVVQTVSADRPLNRLLGMHLSGADTLGHFLGVQAYGSSTSVTTSRVRADSLVLLLVERNSLRIDTIARVKGLSGKMQVLRRPAGGQAGIVISYNPLAAEEKALLFPDGWIAVAWINPYRVDWRAPNGRWIRGMPLAFSAVELNNREKCAVMQRSALTRSSPCDPTTLVGWPRSIPPFVPGVTAALLAAPDGRLVIARTKTSVSQGNEYDVVDRQGKLVGRIMLRLNETLVGFGVRSAYVITTDEVDLQTLRRHPWP